jgi:tRNA uridine 5-carboxymethylaminomethyl modification enzyme
MFVFPRTYKTIVIGGGHAGIEASLASARMGCGTLLISMNVDSIGQMSCNPAVGGLAKGTLVREVDALGGEMGINADLCGIQFRMLNTTRGPAVRSPRAQCDRRAYQARMKWVCEREPNLDVFQAQVSEIVCSGDQVAAVRVSIGVEFRTAAVIVTTGTFLRGLMHIGRTKNDGGRAGDLAASGLSDSLRKLGLELGRMKTGTPPRILKRSIDFSRTQHQHGEIPAPYFTNWIEELFHMEQIGQPVLQSACSSYPPASVLAKIGTQLPCHITYTTPMTASIVKDNIAQSPVYSGAIAGIGPRYCPSIEDKIVRFHEKVSHQVFLEPEGAFTDEVYVNGLSTSLPFEVQVSLVHSIIGCENAVLLRPAYAVEYDFSFPTQLQPSLETKLWKGLFLAGQINGTSGYEEAAAQGIIAGINAARYANGLGPLIIGRNEGYIGVLVDDLVTKGTTEPYRMFTSRAEHRLLLRQDNADLRLSKFGFGVGLLPSRRYKKVQEKQQAIAKEISRLMNTRVGAQTLAQVLSKPSVAYKDLPWRDESLKNDVIQQVEIETKYAGYMMRQKTEVERCKRMEGSEIPPDFDYSKLPNLSTEAQQKLCRQKPSTLGQAARISGMSPSDVSILMVWIKRLADLNKSSSA